MAENYVLLETIQLTQTATSVTFDNIPQTGYTDLKVVISARMSNATNVVDDVLVSLNGSTSSFTMKRFFGAGSGTPAGDAGGANYNWVGIAPNSASTTDVYGNLEFTIPGYTSSNLKNISAASASENNATAAYLMMTSLLWSNTAAITSMTLSGYSSNFLAGSTFSLYATAALGTTPVTAPFATGGNIVANDGTYWYHAFLSSGTFTPAKALSCDYLVVAGGGGGGTKNSNGGGAGGGGAGGLRSTVTATGGGGTLETALALTSGTGIAVIVGAGGTGTNVQATSATNGTNSSFIGGAVSITSIGGGRGGNQGTVAKTGATGGSGGGAGIDGGDANQAGGAGTANQGFGAGNSVAGLPYRGSGGGGAGAASTLASTSQNGGVGVLISAFATPTTTGVSGYYAGGGGGTGDSVNGSGGAGGGGAGHPNSGSGTSGTTNTGGGGGGTNNTYGVSNGGSGIVIVRYPMSS